MNHDDIIHFEIVSFHLNLHYLVYCPPGLAKYTVGRPSTASEEKLPVSLCACVFLV